MTGCAPGLTLDAMARTHKWNHSPRDPMRASCECGLIRVMFVQGAFHQGYYLRDGLTLDYADQCTRDLTTTRRRASGGAPLAPFLRGDPSGDKARAALPKRPPGRNHAR